VTLQGTFAIVHLAFERQQGLGDRAELIVQTAQIPLQRVALGLQGGGAKLVFTRLDPDRTGATPVKAVGLRGDPVAAGPPPGGWVVHTTQVLQLLDQPAWQLGIKAHLGQQAVWLSGRHGLAGGHGVVAVTLG